MRRSMGLGGPEGRAVWLALREKKQRKVWKVVEEAVFS